MTAQLYQQAAAASGALGVGVDSLTSSCTQPPSGVPPTAIGQAFDSLRHPWMFTARKFNFIFLYCIIM